MKDFGLYNVVFEADLGDAIYDFNEYSLDNYCQLLKKWILWVYDNWNKKAKVVINFRDLPDFMDKHSDRLFKIVDFLAKFPPETRMFGIVYEEPRGMSLPEEVGLWAKFIRKIMEDNSWNGKLLVHVHEKFGYCDATALEVRYCSDLNLPTSLVLTFLFYINLHIIIMEWKISNIWIELINSSL